MRTTLRILASITFLTLISVPAESQFWSGSRLLLPYFEVDIDSAETTTLFSVTNTADEAVLVRAFIHSNWGIELLVTDFELAAHDVLTVDLYRWLAEGNVPDGPLPAEELERVKSAFCGESTPPAGHYFSDEVSYRRAVGYVYFEVIGGPAERDVLIGDYFVLTPSENYAQGQALLNIDPAAECSKICYRHGLRFLSGGFDAGTEIFIWTEVQGEPSEDGYYPNDRIRADVLVYDEQGNLVAELERWLLPVQLLKVDDLDLPEQFGWLDIRTAERSFISVRYGAFERFSVGLKTFCLRTPPEDPGPDIRLEKRTNGIDADFPPGPTIQVGAPVNWTYEVTNTGGTPLDDVAVTDSRGVAVDCPLTSLGPNQQMTCTGSGTAAPCQYDNLGTVVATDPDGNTVQDDDPSHYFGGLASIDIEKETLGENGVWYNADGAPGATSPIGPEISQGGSVSWRYTVENTGSLDLTNISVSDDQDVAVDCLGRTSLAAGNTMTCSGSGFAPSNIQQLYQYQNIGSVTGRACGSVEVLDSDPSHYHTHPLQQCNRPFVIQDQPSKLFGQDALEPGPWTEICSFGDQEVNNVGYRATDGFLYGVELTANGNTGFVAKINPASCSTTLLGIEGLPADRRFDAGDISSNGRWMYINFAGINQQFYRVDLTSPTLPLQAEHLTVTGHSGFVHDWTYDPSDGSLYGGDRAGQVARLVKTGPSTYQRIDITVPGLRSASDGEGPSGAYGGALLISPDRLLLHRNSGQVYEIDVSDPANPIRVSEGAARGSGFNDGVCAVDP